MNYGRDGVAASPVKQGEARKKERTDDLQREGDLVEVASSVTGRRFLNELILGLGAVASVQPGLPEDVKSYLEGRRSVGTGILARMWQRCPNMLIKLIEENPVADEYFMGEVNDAN